MAVDLQGAARAAGLRDLDLLKLADPSLSPTSAVDALRRKYPAAFLDARKMSDAEFKEAVRTIGQETPDEVDRRRRDFIAAELEKPDIRKVSRAEFEERKQAFVRAMR